MGWLERMPTPVLVTVVLCLPIVTTRPGDLWVKEHTGPSFVALDGWLSPWGAGPWSNHRRSARAVEEGSLPQQTCNTGSSRPCLCLADHCSINSEDTFPTPDTLTRPTSAPSPDSDMVWSSSSQPLPCCVKVLPTSELLQIVTLRLEKRTILDYTAELEDRLQQAVVAALNDYCYTSLEEDRCGLTSTEINQTPRQLFTKEGVFITNLQEVNDNGGAYELQVSFAVYVNAIGSDGNLQTEISTTTDASQAHSRVLSADVLVAMIQSETDDIGYRLGVVVLTPTYRWRDLGVTSPPPTPTQYPLGLNFWQFFYMCFGAALGIFFVIISIISTIKAIIDRKRIKRRIKERREERLRQKEAEKDDSSGADKEPLTNHANGSGPGNDLNVKDATDAGFTPNAQVVQVTVHDVQLNCPTTDGQPEMALDLDSIRVSDILSDFDSAIASESNSFAETTNQEQSAAEGGKTKVGNNRDSQQDNIVNDQRPRDLGMSSAENDCRARNLEEGDYGGRQWNQENGVHDLHNRSIEHVKQVDGDVIQVMSTPERKRAGILTPPKFFSPKKQKGENLMVQSPSLGEKEVGLDNMAFD